MQVTSSDVNMLVYLAGFTIFLCVLHIVLNYNKKARILRKIPGPTNHFVVGNGFTILHSSVELMKMARIWAGTWDRLYRIWAFPIGAVIIYNPDDVETITSNMKYIDKSPIYNILKPWLRDGLLLSKGAKWQHRRKILTPTFHFNVLCQFFNVLEDNGHRLVETLLETAGQPINVVPVISEFTLSSICETAMGTHLKAESKSASKSYKDTINLLGTLFYERLIKIHYYSDFIYNLTISGIKQKKWLKTVHGFTQRVIQQRKEYLEKQEFKIEDRNEDDVETNVYKKSRKVAMLDLLLLAQKEGQIDRTGVQEEVDTFMFEGHDTTASGLTMCLMLLANHRKIQDQIVAELKEIFGDSNRSIKMEDLSKMKYLECCIKESLRLYPPVHFISRSINEDTILSNYTVPAGTHCHILIYDLHRRADLFPNPEVFDPERFLPEKSVGRHPYAYIPFSAGPRNCIGQKFAMMEMKVAVTHVLRQFILEPVTRPQDLQFLADIVLRNDGPVLVNFIPRPNYNPSD